MFSASLDCVLPYLVQTLSNPQSPLTTLGLTALHNWVDFGLPLVYVAAGVCVVV